MTRAELLQIAKPILFNTDMTVAILEDRKTATRRLIKPQLSEECPVCKYVHNEYIYDVNAQNIYCARCGEPLRHEKRAPYQPGDILYVRETWKIEEFYDDEALIRFRAGGEIGIDYECEGETYSKLSKYADDIGWEPSLFMPKEAARIFLKVKDVRVERLKDMRSEDALNEGIKVSEFDLPHTGVLNQFKKLWESTIKKSDLARYGWDANPWVWVIEFERIEPESEGE